MFKRIHLEISNICNVQCSFCPIVDRPKEVMSLSQIEQSILQIKPLTEDICLHLMGEPLAHPQFEEILKICDHHQTQIQITTNGILTKKYTDLLLSSSSLRQINFSLQAFKDNFPERNIDEYLKPILRFTERSFEERPELYINYRLWNHGIETFKENEEFFLKFESFFDVKINRNVDPGHIKSKKILESKRLYLHFDSRFEWPNPNFPKRSEKGTCQGLRNHFGIHADGTVVPCCLDKEAVINLGNVFETGVSDILNSPRAQAIKNGFEAGELVEDLCQRCTFISRFDKK